MFVESLKKLVEKLESNQVVKKLVRLHPRLKMEIDFDGNGWTKITIHQPDGEKVVVGNEKYK